MEIIIKTITSHFESFIISVLESYGLPSSKSAIILLIMIAAHESGGLMYVRQIRGPARGLFQMEPISLNAVLEYLRRKPDKFDSMQHYLNYSADHLIYDTVAAIVFARIYLMMDPEPLPDEDDLLELAKYAKRRWNTEAGKATVDDYLMALNELPS